MSEIKWWVGAGIAGILFFMVMNRSVTQPLKWIWYGLLYSAVGGIVLFIVNLLGQYVHFHLPINPVTALITGWLGIPGLFYLIVVKLVFIGG
ncbi:pro-sigmaK processing inhibitor BofA family protein [Lihuaxuella thermophila]|uniref:Inhibitor of the pro-sigma K processing machinery n=1 Tax=Lihuaxuella thermophila TaxID=1173111 RepID=A0A1H8BT48_9BACL|nr:pro-sigmaK processing inhibitor BofA family protein [Lihuaxuella thermophila]SEM85932.1 inhibitor of the pro-sigma K processing machinery [Lihuaxuella thermophila]